MAGTDNGPETVLTTDRLVVRQWNRDDRDRAFDIYSRWEVAQWLGTAPRALAAPEEALQYIERCRERSTGPRYGVWAVERRDTGVVAGAVLLLPRPGGDSGGDSDGDGARGGDARGDEVEIGWHLHPDSWGHGIASEAARAVLAKGFADGLTEIHAMVAPDNARSAAVCRRLGMTSAGLTDRWYGRPMEDFRIGLPAQGAQEGQEGQGAQGARA